MTNDESSRRIRSISDLEINYFQITKQILTIMAAVLAPPEGRSGPM
jgi:hypothetical protein